VRDLILRPAIACLARRLTGLRDDGGRGAVAVLVAILIGGGVLFGMAALVLDVGQLYQNKAELQNGADSAALAVAKSCAAGACPASATAYATTYAALNASQLTGGKANVVFVCGVSGPHGTVPLGNGTCPVAIPSGAKNVCPANPTTAGRNYVDVETSTLLPSGKTVLPPVFASALTGGNPSGTVYACAQVQWDGRANASGIALTVSSCSWDSMTNGGQTFALPPPYPPNPSSSLDQVVYLKSDAGGTGGCSTEPNGAAAPGNFSWTDDAGGCTSLITGTTPGSTYGGNPGNNVSKDCKTQLPIWQAAKTVLTIPIYLKVSLNGQNATYTLAGPPARFVITGYHLTGLSDTKDWITGKVPCSGNDRCVSGFFVHQIDTSGSLGAGDFGFDIIKLTG